MLIRLLQFLKGYVRIKVSGYSPERFMNLCSNHDILLWNMENHCDYYIMCISIPGFFSLKPFLRKTRTKVDVLEKYGLPFFIPKLIRRKIFVVGLGGCLFTMVMISNYVWAITISGNTQITTDLFLDYLKKNDITYGTRKKSIDIEELEEAIREDYDNVTWASVRITGTKLEIMIKENEHTLVDQEISKMQDKDQNASSDLVAGKDGTVVGMVTRSGVPLVAKDSVVVKGDILIKGQIPILGEDGLVRKYQYCEADADIYLQCNYDYVQEVPLKYRKNVPTGREKKIPFVEIFGKSLAFGSQKIPYLQYEKIADMKQIRLFDNFYLPIYYGKMIIREYQIQEVARNQEEGKELLKERLNKFLQSLEEKGVQIIEKNVKIETVNGKMVEKGQISVIELTGDKVVRDITAMENEIMQNTQNAQAAGE